jgi:hypothetical protein
MNQDDIDWAGPTCPVCGRELDASPLLVEHAISVAYSCPVHGITSLVNPFEDLTAD